MADAYLGEIRAFAGNYAPQGWAICDGSEQQIQQYEALFSLIGVIYGGDGVKTFKLPDLRGRLAIGMGQGTGLTNRAIGSNGGTETETLTLAQIPNHNHTVTVSTVTNPASVNAPSENAFLGAINSNAAMPVGYSAAATTGVTPYAMNTATITKSGGSNLHNNIMPITVINYIICMSGFYPTRP